MLKLRTEAGIVPKEVLAPIVERADVDCPRCHGNGISGYRHHGNAAVVCKCVETILRAEAADKLAKEAEHEHDLPSPVMGNPSPEATHEQSDSR